MIRRPPRSTQSRSSAASDVYKRQGESSILGGLPKGLPTILIPFSFIYFLFPRVIKIPSASTSSGYLPYVFRNSSTCIGSSVLSLYASQLIEFILDMPLHSLALIFAPNSTLALLFPLTMGRTYG